MPKPRSALGRGVLATIPGGTGRAAQAPRTLQAIAPVSVDRARGPALSTPAKPSTTIDQANHAAAADLESQMQSHLAAEERRQVAGRAEVERLQQSDAARKDVLASRLETIGQSVFGGKRTKPKKRKR